MHFKKSGFTLIELSIVLTIFAVMMASGIQAYNVYAKNQKLVVTKQRLADIKSAIEAYKTATGYYPCPALRNAQPETATYAVVTDCTVAASAGVVDSATGGTAGTVVVRIGSIPARTINLPGDEMEDAWGRRFTYAVVKSMAMPSPTGSGAIDIVDTGGFSVINPAKSAPYILVSHGSDGIGAYTHAGLSGAACTGAGKDLENCNDDAKFVYTTDMASLPGAAHYDDIISYAGSGAAAQTPATPTSVTYLGLTPTVYDANLGGPAGANAKCVAAFGAGARMMTFDDFKKVSQTSFPGVGWFDCSDGVSEVWPSGSPGSTGYCADIQIYAGYNCGGGSASCQQWTSNAGFSSGNGYTCQPNGPLISANGTVGSAYCNTLNKIHCVK